MFILLPRKVPGLSRGSDTYVLLPFGDQRLPNGSGTSVLLPRNAPYKYLRLPLCIIRSIRRYLLGGYGGNKSLGRREYTSENYVKISG